MTTSPSSADPIREALELFVSFGCPRCSGDCASASPPVTACPMQAATRALSLPTKASDQYAAAEVDEVLASLDQAIEEGAGDLAVATRRIIQLMREEHRRLAEGLTDATVKLLELQPKASDDELVERVANRLEPMLAEPHLYSAEEFARAAISSMPTIADEGERARIVRIASDYIKDAGDFYQFQNEVRALQSSASASVGEPQRSGVPASPSGCQASPSAADASSQSGIPNAGDGS
jgi:hypothetical protein